MFLAEIMRNVVVKAGGFNFTGVAGLVVASDGNETPNCAHFGD